ncbi:uncharacterized protein LOC143153171 isoform X2 [Ptiloglossa arizonensis]|uniref:uncharacterized protein LOC143153171 isoform X2 n=1 Tax=Ptiloglossa arizonensis TaxID=3350558 RepID=UPI003F9F401C
MTANRCRSLPSPLLTKTISAAIVSQRNPALQSRKPNFQMESRENSCYASIALSEARGGNITSVLFDSKSELA